jgi:hypothetical protein
VEAERFYRAPLERYPDDAEGWNGLGETLFHLISIAAAEERTAVLDSLVAEYVQLRPDGRLAVMARTQRAVLLDDAAVPSPEKKVAAGHAS